MVGLTSTPTPQLALNGNLSYNKIVLPWLILIRKLEQFYIEEPKSSTLGFVSEEVIAFVANSEIKRD